jgi:hypothetical protein
LFGFISFAYATSQPVIPNSASVTAATPNAPKFKQSSSELMGLYDAQDQITTMEIPLDKPHRSTVQVGEWIAEHVTSAMTINPTDFAKQKKQKMVDFEPYAVTEYEGYLSSTSMLQTLQTNTLKMNAILNGEVKLVSEGALNGTYRWLYDVPLLLTFYPSSLAAFNKEVAANNFPNQKVTFRVQAGRMAKNKDVSSEGLLLERWSAVQ